MHYAYILRSRNHNLLYTGSTKNLKRRFFEHNAGLSFATKPYRPWELVFYSAFKTRKLAEGFETYLKSGSGKAFAYKRLLDSTNLIKAVDQLERN